MFFLSLIMYIRIYLFICTYVLCFVFVCKQAQRMIQPLFAVQFTLHNHSVYLSFLLPSSPLLCFFFAVHPSISLFILAVLAVCNSRKLCHIFHRDVNFGDTWRKLAQILNTVPITKIICHHPPQVRRSKMTNQIYLGGCHNDQCNFTNIETSPRKILKVSHS